jgi:GNAT superfamily N-acetyltransferase
MTVELEAVERGEIEALHAAATNAMRDDIGLACDAIGTALVSVAARIPPSGIVVNRAIGLGVEREEREETIDAIAGRYRRAGVRRYFVHVHPESRPPGIRQWLLDRGLERTRGWMKFTRGREAPPTVQSSAVVRRARLEDMAAFGRIAAAAFDLGDRAADWVACLNRAAGWRAYVSLIDGEVAGTGGLFVRDGIGWLDFGATAPKYRGKGSQSALLRLRILEALDLGCRLIGTATGEAVEGDPQHSYRNITKMGFREAYLRENYAPPREPAR